MKRGNDRNNTATAGKGIEMKMVYMVCKDKRAVISYNKKESLDLAKQESGEVYQLSYGYYKDCNFIMDMPTFKTIGTKIY